MLVIARQTTSPPVTILQPIGWLNSHAIDDFNKALHEFTEGKEGVSIVLDLSRITNIGSQVIGVLTRYRERVHGSGGQLRFAGLSREVEDVFRISNLDQLFHIHPDVETALREMG